MKWKLVPCYLLMPISQQAYFPLHNPTPFPIIWERQTHFCKIKHFCKVKLNGKSLGWGSEKAGEAADGEHLAHPSDKQHLVSIAGRQQSHGCCCLTKYFPNLQLKPHDFPLYKEEGEFLRAATQPSLNASHTALPVLPTQPVSLSALKDQLLNCRISFCTSVYV